MDFILILIGIVLAFLAVPKTGKTIFAGFLALLCAFIAGGVIYDNTIIASAFAISGGILILYASITTVNVPTQGYSLSAQKVQHSKLWRVILGLVGYSAVYFGTLSQTSIFGF